MDTAPSCTLISLPLLLFRRGPSFPLTPGGGRSDGVRRSPMGERFNYVALSGAHQLNMTRAFGNFGHKEWRGSKPVRTHRPPWTGAESAWL